MLRSWRRGSIISGLLVLVFLFGFISAGNAETDVTDKVELIKSRLMFDRSTNISYLDVAIKNVSGDVLLTPIKVVIDSISDSRVTVGNPDGYTDDQKPYFNYTPENSIFEPGQTLWEKIWKFTNPSRSRFSYTTRVMGSIPDGSVITGPEGGTLNVSNPMSALNGLTVEIPPGALLYEEYITVVEVTEDLPDIFSYASPVMKFASNSNFFEKNIQIKVPYNDADNDGIVDGTDIYEDDIRVVTYDKLSDDWSFVPIKEIDTLNKVVTFEVNHFTLFYLVQLQYFWDTNNPNFVSMSISPSEVDVRNGPGQINVSVQATDDLSGIGEVHVIAKHRMADYWLGGPKKLYQESFLDLVSGNIWNGTFNGILSIPQWNSDGQWTIAWVRIVDLSGNSYTANLENESYTFNVVSDKFDIGEPNFSSISLSPATLDVSNGPGEINVTVQATDDRSGISWLWVTARSECDLYSISEPIMNLTSGSNLNGTFQGTLTIPQWNSNGKWKITEIWLRDYAGNSYMPDLSNDGYSFNVISDKTDTEEPNFLSLIFSPTVVDVSNGQGQINVSVQATDDISGISEVTVWAKSESGQLYAYGYLHLTSGSNLNGTFQGSISIPQWNSIGQWQIYSISIIDNAQNYYWNDLSYMSYFFTVK